jgi:hypothetical protein
MISTFGKGFLVGMVSAEEYQRMCLTPGLISHFRSKRAHTPRIDIDKNGRQFKI